MASIMQIKDLKNKPSRDGFDLSAKVNFSAKYGELLPVWRTACIPGDKISVDLKMLSRTLPVNTPAFARTRHYYDFYFVPYHMLWKNFDACITQMYNNTTHAYGMNYDDNLALDGYLPNFTLRDLQDYIHYLQNDDSVNRYKDNYFGFSRAELTCKLMSYLRYSNLPTFTDFLAKDQAWTYNDNPLLNLLPLLAYQLIYFAHYRFSQWEKSNPSCFNVDYIKGTGDATLTGFSNEKFAKDFNFFDLRYCNYQMDYFHGLLPNAQYGSEAVVPIDMRNAFTNGTNVALDGDFRALGSGTHEDALSGYVFRESPESELPQDKWISTVAKDYNIRPRSYLTGRQLNLAIGPDSAAKFSILALRQAECLQKWKEITQSGDEDYRSQIKKHWGVSSDERAGSTPRYLGGVTMDMSINEVVNTNITGDFAADIAGKGFGTGNGEISCSVGGEYGICMCIFHALPIVDYITSGIHADNLRVHATDYAIPEFDKVGMQQIPYIQAKINSSRGTLPTDFQGMLGFAPRYIDYKTDYDYSLGIFQDTLQSYILPFTDKDIGTYINPAPSGVNPNDKIKYIYYNWFKVNPRIGDKIFAVNVDSSVNTDQFLCSCFFKCNIVRNLDRDGLPY